MSKAGQIFFDKIRPGLATATILLVIVLFTPVSHAGGLGFAILAVTAGLAGHLGFSWWFKLSDIPGVVIAVMAFLAWAVTTSIWSPYDDPQMLSNPAKLFIGVMLYLGVFWAPKLPRSHWLLIAIGMISLGLLLFDLLTDYSLSKSFYPLKEGMHPRRRHDSIYQNLAHAITVLTLIAGTVIYHLWHYKAGKILAVIWALLVFYAAYEAQLAVGLLGLSAALIFMVLAIAIKNKAIDILIFIGAASIIFAPLAGYAMNYVSAEAKAGMNDSWEHRVEMWAYVAEMIAQKPIIGHGFDAVRTFERTYTGMNLNGAPWEQNIIALHPHNAGLHIWSETGAIGAALACISLFMLRHTLKNAMDKVPGLVIPMAGFLAAALTLCTFSYGIWQEWFWGALILIGALIPMSIMNAK